MKILEVILETFKDFIRMLILFPIALLIIDLFLMLIFAISMAIECF